MSEDRGNLEERFKRVVRELAARYQMPESQIEAELRASKTSVDATESLAARVGVSPAQLTAEVQERMRRSTYPTAACVHPGDLELYAGSEHLPAPLEEHVRECAGCKALLELARPTDERVGRFREGISGGQATLETASEPRSRPFADPIRAAVVSQSRPATVSATLYAACYMVVLAATLTAAMSLGFSYWIFAATSGGLAIVLVSLRHQEMRLAMQTLRSVREEHEYGREKSNLLVPLRRAAGLGMGLVTALGLVAIVVNLRAASATLGLPALETLGEMTALRAFRLGERASNEGRREQAIALYERAISIDSSFAMAHRKLAAELSNIGAEPSRIVLATSRAFQHRDRLTPVEGHLVAALYYTKAQYNVDSTIAAYRAALDLDSVNITALNNLSQALRERRSFAEAEQLAQRAIAVDPRPWQVYQNAVAAQVGQAQYLAAAQTTARFAAVAPGGEDNPITVRLRAELAAAERDYGKAESLFLRLLEDSSPSWKRTASLDLSAVERVRGRLAQSDAHARSYMNLSVQQDDPGAYVEGATDLALTDVVLRGDRESAAQEVDGALARFPLESIPALDRPYSELAFAYAVAGKVDRAKGLLRDAESSLPEPFRQGDAYRHAAFGAIALADGKPTQAIAAFKEWYDQSGCAACGLFQKGQAYELVGRLDSAVASYEQVRDSHGLYKLYDESLWLGPTLKRLGDLYMARGQREKAVESYTSLLDLWTSADPELRPTIREVRGKMAQLVKEPR